MKGSLVGFYDELFKKSIPIGAAPGAIDLPNGTLIARLNDTPLLHGGANDPISTAQDQEFGVAFHDVDNVHGEKKYINADK